jgi:hypothetical protein
MNVSGDRLDVGARQMDGHDADEARNVTCAQRRDCEVAAPGTGVAAGECVTARAGRGEDAPPAAENRRLCLPVPAAAAEEGQGGHG